jgi:hypothetical protein
MVYKSGTLGTYEAYDYIKEMISRMGNVKEFRAFQSDTNPYYEIEDGCKKYYHLILIDDRENEFWIDTNSGNSETEPGFIEKILQLVGIRQKYSIDKKEIVHEKDLELNHDLNLLVMLEDLNDSREEHKILFMLEAKFNNASLRLKVIKALKTLGNMCSHNMDDRKFNKCFEDYKYVDSSFGEYTINNVLFINRHLKNISRDNLRELLNTMFVSICGDSGKLEFRIINEEIRE